MQLEFINCILCIIAVQGTCFTQFMYFFTHQSLNFHISVSKLPDDVGASPIDIARAYMVNRISEAGFGSKSLNTKDEGALIHDNVTALKPSSPSPSPKSSTCWPGATVQYQRGFMTPQSQRERFGPHISPELLILELVIQSLCPRYVEPSFLMPMACEHDIISLSAVSNSRYGQVNSRGKTVYDGHGSVEPIQRTMIQRKFVAEYPSRGSANYHSTLDSPRVENLNAFEGLFSGEKKNIETGGTSSPSEFLLADSKPQSSEVGVPTVLPYSRQVAQKILEHLDSNLPTPKEKSAEFRLATSWKKLHFNKNNSLANLGGLDSSGKSDQADKKNSVQGTVDRGNVLFNFAPRGASIQANDAANSNTSASDMKAVPNAAA
ncbi:hypothetical protein NC651_015420 [Populus alba x Populus x berolinensis]|nr:hypothetical protein NC651_015420 [Populus alba x Populus x berolinensis]